MAFGDILTLASLSTLYEFNVKNQALLHSTLFCNDAIFRKSAVSKACQAFLFSAILLCAFGFKANAGTTTADFLKWERKAQEAYLQNSISMAGIIASQADAAISECLDRWYFKSDAIAQQRNDEILKLMPQYAQFRPQAFVMAYIEEQCGKFPRK